MASTVVGGGVLLVADALAEVKRCSQELSAIALSGSISSLLSENIIDDMVSLELRKRGCRTVIRRHLSVGVLDHWGAAVSRNHETTLICVYTPISWARLLECTREGPNLSFFPYFCPDKYVRK